MKWVPQIQQESILKTASVEINMTDEQINLKIAEWRGTHMKIYHAYNNFEKISLVQSIVDLRGGGKFTTISDSASSMSMTGYKCPPNYCGDLNAMREIEQLLQGDDILKYESYLKKTIEAGERFHGRSVYVTDKIWHTKARHRAMAFVLVMNL